MRSMGITRLERPSASISAAVVSRLPAMGSERSSEVEDEGWVRPSPSRMVRAVMATSKPLRARASAPHRPMPRLAPVTRATFARHRRSLLVLPDDLHHSGDLMAAVDMEQLPVDVGGGVAE